MTLTYRNSIDDYRAYAELMTRDSVADYRRWLLHHNAWVGSLVVIGLFVAVRGEQIVGGCLIVAWIAVYLGNQMSTSDWWRTQVEKSAAQGIDRSVTLEISDHGVQERYLGVQNSVPWEQIRWFARYRERTIISYLKVRGFVVPDADLTPEDVHEMVSMLKARGVEERDPKAAEPGATDNPDDAQRLRENH